MPNVSISFSVGVLVAVIAAALAVVVAWLFYRRTLPPVPPGTKLLLITLRSLALCLLLMIVLEPLLRLVSTTTQQPVLAVLLDNSKSMTITDGEGKRSEKLRQVLAENLSAALALDGEVRFYAFGSTTRALATGAFDSLTLDDDATNISAALRAVAEERERLNIGAMVLISDGNYNLGQNPVYDAERLGIPIFTVGIGDSTEQKDVLITKVVTNELVYAETEVPVDVTVKSSGYKNDRIDVTLVEGGKELSRAQVTLQEGTREYAVRLSYVPEGEGVKRYAVRLSNLPGELTTANNRRTFLARVLKSKLRVLILAGSPSPDLAIIKQTMREDKNLHVRSLTQKSSTSFYERENLNTLLDSADCVVLIGFPSATTSEATVGLVQAAVARRTIPLMFVNGRSVDERKLGAFSAILPFTASAISSQEQLVFADPVPAQKHHPILATNTEEGAESWKRLPPIFKTQTLYRAKPEATVLATTRINTIALNNPLIVIRTVNKQKTLAVLGYGIWRWRLMAQGTPQTERLLATFLANSIRWLTTRDESRPVKVTPSKPDFAQGEPIDFVGQVYDANANPIENATVRVAAVQDGQEYETTLRPIGNGRYEGTLEGLPRGDYTFKAVASLEGLPLGEDRGRFSVGELNLEYQDTRMNVQLLRQLAGRSGGAFLLPSELAQLPSKLKGHASFVSRDVRNVRERELWNWPYMLAAVVALFATEWFVRKRNGML